MHAEFTIRVKTILGAGRLFGEYDIRADKDFAMELNGPFGMQAGRFVLRDSSFEMTLGRGEVHIGTVDTLSWERLTGFPLPPLSPRELFFPYVVLPEDSFQTRSFQVTEDSTWIWQIETRDGYREIELDPQQSIPLVERWYENGVISAEKTYHAQRGVKRVPLAHRLTVTMPGPLGVQLDIGVESYKLKRQWKKDPFVFQHRAEL
ncbi:hypothetical protein GF324_11080 [bacterium]|nr:hypothetical protein [bacterium]